jgi:hypothetical protein
VTTWRSGWRRLRARHRERDDAEPALRPFDLVEFVVDRGEDVLEAFDLTQPAVLVGFVELFDQPFEPPWI